MSTRTFSAALALCSLLLAACDPKSSAGAIGVPKPAPAAQPMDPSKMDDKYEPAPRTKLQPRPEPELDRGEPRRVDDKSLQPLP